MLRALAHPAYRRLFLAQVASLAGTGLLTVALGLLAFDLAGANAGQVLGTVFAVKMLAYVLVAPLAGAWLANLPRRAVMVGADAVRIAAVLFLPFVAEAWHVYALVFLLQSASATFTPTFQSVIPQVLEDEEDFTAALSLSRLAYDLESVLSPALAGLLLLFMANSSLFFWTAFGFAGSALLVLSVAVPPVPAHPGQRGAPFLRRVRHGLLLFVRTAALRPVLALNLAVAAAGAFVLVQTVVIAKSVFGLGDGAVALFLALNGLGSMAAALILPRLLARAGNRQVMAAGALLLTGATAAIPLALAAPGPAGPAAVAALWVAVGWSWASVETPVGRVVRASVAPSDLPAAFAAQFSLSHACWLLTYPLAGWLGSASLPAAALVLAVVAGAATVTALVLWPAGDEGPG
ncbi:MFS transporter [Zafaria cholistanensis]|uniref:MFS transporter n=1 Tax=Zafaria cholistanensis TaxID=1682741 RepID=A0A5A7NMD4_9MICC|nr:MFS transporter [Zafaria cholistanensis]GER21930.1 MFS transporter [Zafaria cholistanensis]